MVQYAVSIPTCDLRSIIQRFTYPIPSYISAAHISRISVGFLLFLFYFLFIKAEDSCQTHYPHGSVPLAAGTHHWSFSLGTMRTAL